VPSAPPSLLRFDTGIDLAAFAALLRDAGYTQEALEKLKGLPAADQHFDLSPLLLETQEPTRLNTLLRLFFLAQPVPSGAADDALTPIGVQPLIDMGLLVREVDSTRCHLWLLPAEGRLMAHDYGPGLSGRPIEGDHVLGVGMATRLLMKLTVRRQAERVLDIGTGQGFQAIVASGHAAVVIGTDINQRALDCARLSCGLNNAELVDLRLGSFFEPVIGEAPFDLIVSNPPFVISPPHGLVCLGGGGDGAGGAGGGSETDVIQGDGVVERVVRGSHTLLREDGYCSIVCNWHHAAEDDWALRPTQWLEGSGCDLLILKLKTEDPQTYAKRWLKESWEGLRGGAKTPEEALAEWLKYYKSLGAAAITFGAIIFRKRSGRNWVRADAPAPEHFDGSLSQYLERLFDNQTFLEGLRDPMDLLKVALLPAPDLEIEQRLRVNPEGGWGMARAVLRLVRGFLSPVSVGGPVIDLLSRCDGHRSVGDIVAQAARQAGGDPAAALSQVAPVVERLLKSGHLVPRQPP